MKRGKTAIVQASPKKAKPIAISMHRPNNIYDVFVRARPKFVVIYLFIYKYVCFMYASPECVY